MYGAVMDNDQETQYRSILARAEEASARPAIEDQDHDALYWQLHDLAEAHYEPAIPFFERCLYNTNARWREDAIRLLGFHYLDYLRGNADLFNHLRYMLIEDPSSDVRITAAMLLRDAKEDTDFPDWALLRALEEDPVIQVRGRAFESLLTQTGVSYEVLRQTMRRIDHEEIDATPSLLKQLIEEHGLDLPTEELTVPFRVRHPLYPRTDQDIPPSTKGR